MKRKEKTKEKRKVMEWNEARFLFLFVLLFPFIRPLCFGSFIYNLIHASFTPIVI